MSNTGLVSFYSFRPHVEILKYLSDQEIADGNKPYYLMCTGGLKSCYNLKLKQKSKVTGCTQCIMGSIASYNIDFKYVTTLNKDQKVEERTPDLRAYVKSTVATLHRIEHPDQYNTNEVQKTWDELTKSAEIVYRNAIHWIKKNKLTKVILFNGRFDMLNTIRKACIDLDIEYFTYERTLFGYGLKLYKNQNCLHLDFVHEIVKELIDNPLSEFEFNRAVYFSLKRYLNVNHIEWRLYNTNSQKRSIFSRKKLKILIVPSSRHEFEGNESWELNWEHNTNALELLISNLRKTNECDIVFRSHPNWGEMIGKSEGKKSIEIYREFCTKNDLKFIEPDDSIDTHYLIEEADIIVLNGGSSLIQAGVLGKEIINLGPCEAAKGKFLTVLNSLDEIENYKFLAVSSERKKEIQKYCLRYIDILSFKIPYRPYQIRSTSATKNRYSYEENEVYNTNVGNGEKVNLLNDLLADEEAMIEYLKEGEKLYELQEIDNDIKRRFGLNWIDSFRNFFPKGDQ